MSVGFPKLRGLVGTALDGVVGVFSPRLGKARAWDRAQMEVMATFNSGAGADTNHSGASFKRSAGRNWWPWSSIDPDEETLPEREILVARSRDAYRNQSIARSAINTMLTSVIGSGLEMHCRIDRDFLGFRSDEEASAWESNVERLFDAWANSTDADAARKHTFYRLQNIAFKASRHTGEIFALLPLVPRKNTICSLRVQLIEADRVSTPNGKTDGNGLFKGIEVGQYGDPIAYHIEMTKPEPFQVSERKWERVLAYGSKSGRRQAIHFFDEDRPGQRRGLPTLTPILEQLKQISRYSEAELMAAVVAAMLTVFVTKESVDSDPLKGFQKESSGPYDSAGENELRSGAIIDLNPGEKVETVNPGRPNVQFGPFMDQILRQVGMGLGIPFEVLTKQFNSSYSASRAAIMQAWEVFRVERDWFIQEFLQPIYVEWLSQMIASGRVDAPGFFQDVEIQRAYCQADWYGPVPLQIDPKKEAEASTEKIANMTSTLSEETANKGGDYQRNLRQLKREQDLIDRYGLRKQEPPVKQPEPPAPEEL